MQYCAQDVFRQASMAAALGWKIVRLYGVRNNGSCTCQKGAACRTPGKHPAGGGQWHLRATDDEEQISSWFDFSDHSQDRRVNCGVLVGPASGLVDVEADNPEAEEVIKEFGLDQIPTCRYKSTRGVHHLFQHQIELPDTAVVHVGALEVRIGGGGRAAQSVMPCSWHTSGVQYQWLHESSPEFIQPARLPDSFLQAILTNSTRRGSGVVGQSVSSLTQKKRAGEGDRHAFLLGIASHLASMTTRSGRLDDKEADLILQIVASLNETHCDPPKGIEEVEKIVKDQWRYYRERRLDGIGRRPLEKAGLEWCDETREYEPGRWKMTVIHSEPKSYRITIPNTEKADPHQVYVESAKILQSCRDMANAILDQTDRLDVLDPDPQTWAKVWNGQRTRNEDGEWVEKRSLRVKLLETADDEYPTSDESEIETAADVLLCYLETFRQERGDDDESMRPIHDGTPRWIMDKDGVWQLLFKVTPALGQACKRSNIATYPLAVWKKISARWREECEPEDLNEKGRLKEHCRLSTNGKNGKFVSIRERQLEALARVAGR